MASSRISEQNPPNIDVTRSSVAYGDRAIPKLKRELAGDDDQVRLQALRSLCDKLRNPMNVKEATDEGIAQETPTLLKHSLVEVRRLAAQLLVIVSNHPVGRDSILANGLLTPISQSFDDADVLVREGVHRVTQNVTLIAGGVHKVLEMNLTATLVTKLDQESDTLIKEHILATLHNCMKVNTAPCLATPAIQVFVGHMTHTNAAIRAGACLALTDATFPLEGKEQAVKYNAIPQLVELLQDGDTDVRARAASSLMTVCITTEAKKVVVETDVVDRLGALLDDASTSVKLAAVKAITTIADAPEARRDFRHYVDKLEEIKGIKLTSFDPDALTKAVEKAIASIQWKP
eukprot:m.132304 g.132304  ORF g.132304 m.132304 type:complete len:347 (-) comp13932_c0_seq1:710-1750(-)